MAGTNTFLRITALLLALCCLLPAAAFAQEDTAPLFAQRLSGLKTPAEQAVEDGAYTLYFVTEDNIQAEFILTLNSDGTITLDEQVLHREEYSTYGNG